MVKFFISLSLFIAITSTSSYSRIDTSFLKCMNQIPMTMTQFTSLLSSRVYGKKNQDFILNELQKRIHSQKKNPLILFDVHGTLIHPTWKEEYLFIYKEIVGTDADFKWIKKNGLYKTWNEIISSLSEITSKPFEEIKKLAKKASLKFKAQARPPAYPQMLDLIKTLKEKNIPIVIISNGDKNLVLDQLKKTGFMDFLKEEDLYIFSQDNSQNDFKNVIKKIHNKFSNHFIISFDDWTERVDIINKEGGITIGLPQGEDLERLSNTYTLLSYDVQFIVSQSDTYFFESFIGFLR